MEVNTDEPVMPLTVMIREYWAIVVRRKWPVIGSVLAGVMIAGLLCVVLPKSYRSSTLILIENQKIPDDYVKGIGGASIEQRLTMIQQQVMSRTLLSQIIDEFKLYEGQSNGTGLNLQLKECAKRSKWKQWERPEPGEKHRSGDHFICPRKSGDCHESD